MVLSKTDTVMLGAIERGLRIERDGTVIGIKGRPIRGYATRYLAATCHHKGLKANIYFHRLQAYFKFGDVLFEEGVKTRHGEGGPLDNSWNNINIGTHSDNMMDVPRETRRRGTVITDEQVLEIRTMRETGLSCAKIAEKYGVCRYTIWTYVTGRSRAHVWDEDASE